MWRFVHKCSRDFCFAFLDVSNNSFVCAMWIKHSFITLEHPIVNTSSGHDRTTLIFYRQRHKERNNTLLSLIKRWHVWTQWRSLKIYTFLHVYWTSKLWVLMSDFIKIQHLFPFNPKVDMKGVFIEFRKVGVFISVLSRQHIVVGYIDQLLHVLLLL